MTSSSAPRGAVDVLGLAGRDVGEVHAADHPAGRDALVDLRDVQVEAEGLAEGVGLVRRGEPAAGVGEDPRARTPRRRRWRARWPSSSSDRPLRPSSGSHQLRLLGVPAHGLGEPGVERHLRGVAQLGRDLGPVDGVAAVVAEPVGDRLDPRGVGADGVEQRGG